MNKRLICMTIQITKDTRSPQLDHHINRVQH